MYDFARASRAEALGTLTLAARVPKYANEVTGDFLTHRAMILLTERLGHLYFRAW